MTGDSVQAGGAESSHPILQRDQTLAIVLGASEWPSYPDFHAAPSFRRSANDIVDYLRSQNGLNIPSRNVKVLIDSFDDAPELLRQMHDFIRRRSGDLSQRGTPAADLFLYYIGHGGFGDNDAFFLSIRSTEEDDPLATSITAESLGRLIRDRAAGLRTYLVLDCCFAGSASKVFMSGGPLGVAGAQLQEALPLQGDALATKAGKLPEYGTALLCASGSREPAKAPPDLPHTMFTGGLLDVLRNGDPRAPAWLSLDDIQRLVRARLEAQFADKAVLPQVHAPQQRMGRVDLVPLFRNPARSSPTLPVSSDARPVSDQQQRVAETSKHTKALARGRVTERWKRLPLILTIMTIAVVATVSVATTFFQRTTGVPALSTTVPFGSTPHNLLSQITLEPDTDRPGQDYATTGAPDVSSCQKSCQGDEKCKAYTYVPVGLMFAGCWLKNGQPNAVHAIGLTSGVRSR
jgi:PAN domain